MGFSVTVARTPLFSLPPRGGKGGDGGVHADMSVCGAGGGAAVFDNASSDPCGYHNVHTPIPNPSPLEGEGSVRR